MTQGTVSKAGVLALGMKLGRDARESTRRAFYVAAATLFTKLQGSALQDACDALSVAGVAKKLGIPEAEVGSLTKSVRQDAFPSGATIYRFIGYVRRFPDALPDVSLEAYTAAAANALRDAKAKTPAGELVDIEATDQAAIAMVATAVDENSGQPISIRAARDKWQDATKSERVTKSTDQPETVGQRVDWLISQEKAVTEFASDEAGREKVVELAAMLSSILQATK